ncbi:hypothetical protein A3758_19895 [Oleiphilus sp. HI0118]|nr:hypothetical protein A3758_08455 [Oleiphilus sp. HI0118]KZZ43432.1 hypothetical protein A3758_19895 [Oleiphilus sp. HI0118]
MTKIIGHRGARNEAPENTLPSFIIAQKAGCLAFELDVRLSHDLQLMVFHDQTLGRTTGRQGSLSDYSAEVLNKIDARGKSLWPDACYIPTLEQVFHIVPDTVDWQLEVKPTSRVRMRILSQKLNRFVSKLKPETPRITITSSSRWFLKEVKIRNPKIRTGFVSEHLGESSVSVCETLGCDLLVLNHRFCDQATLSLAKQYGLEVSVWTVNDLDRMEELSSLGVDSIITDIPTKALSVMSSSIP